MPRARAHRIVDDDQRQSADVVALPLDQVHLGDLLFERAAGDVDAERIDLVAQVLAIAHAFGAGIRIAVVAIDAVIDLIEDVPRVATRVGQRKAIAATTRRRTPLPDRVAFAYLGLVRNQSVEMGLFRLLEADPIRDGHRQVRIDLCQMRPAPDHLEQSRDELAIGELERCAKISEARPSARSRSRSSRTVASGRAASSPSAAFAERHNRAAVAAMRRS